jgi:2-amino-4-hydroxy-6-hydroxymethyldihydropteridine diphosphokinase
MIAAPVAIGLGGNLGDVAGSFERALAQLDAADGIRIVAVSSLYRSAPVGGPEQPDYLNAAALLAVGVDPHALLALLQGEEVAAARVREERWGPRTLDLDILWWNDLSITTPDLVVPHPRLHERRFALAPLVELVPTAKGADGRAYADVLRELPTDGVEVIGPPALVYDAR